MTESSTLKDIRRKIRDCSAVTADNWHTSCGFKPVAAERFRFICAQLAKIDSDLASFELAALDLYGFNDDEA